MGTCSRSRSTSAGPAGSSALYDVSSLPPFCPTAERQARARACILLCQNGRRVWGHQPSDPRERACTSTGGTGKAGSTRAALLQPRPPWILNLRNRASHLWQRNGQSPMTDSALSTPRRPERRVSRSPQSGHEGLGHCAARSRTFDTIRLPDTDRELNTRRRHRSPAIAAAPRKWDPSRIAARWSTSAAWRWDCTPRNRRWRSWPSTWRRIARRRSCRLRSDGCSISGSRRRNRRCSCIRAACRSRKTRRRTGTGASPWSFRRSRSSLADRWCRYTATRVRTGCHLLLTSWPRRPRRPHFLHRLAPRPTSSSCPRSSIRPTPPRPNWT